MRKLLAALAVTAAATLGAAGAATADTAPTLEQTMGGVTACIDTFNSNLPCSAPVYDGVGQGQYGWVGHRAANGAIFVLPASFSVETGGSSYNVYEPLSATFADSVAWIVPQGVDPAAYSADIARYNLGWHSGMAIVAPNLAGAPVAIPAG